MMILYHGMHCYLGFHIYATYTVPVSVSCNNINAHRGKTKELINVLLINEELEKLKSFACLHMIYKSQNIASRFGNTGELPRQRVTSQTYHVL